MDNNLPLPSAGTPQLRAEAVLPTACASSKPDNQDARRMQARAFLEYAVGLLGIGFHPDTRARHYVDPQGNRVFDDDAAAKFDASVEDAFAQFPDVYEEVIAIWKERGLFC